MTPSARRSSTPRSSCSRATAIAARRSRDVARAANIAKGTVYLYFANKEALFAEICRHVADTFLAGARAAASSEGSLEERITAILAAKFTFLYELVHSSPHASEIIESKNQLANEIIAQADREYAALLAGALEAAAGAGELDLGRSDYDAAAAASLLMRCAFGNSAATDASGRPTIAEYDRRLAAMTRIVLAGLHAGAIR